MGANDLLIGYVPIWGDMRISYTVSLEGLCAHTIASLWSTAANSPCSISWLKIGLLRTLDGSNQLQKHRKFLGFSRNKMNHPI